MTLLRRFSFPLLFSGLLAAQSPGDLQSAKTIADTLSMTPKAMDVRPSISLKVQFGMNSSTLKPAGKQQLDELARALQSPELAGKRFALNGHTDAVGKAAHNLRVSLLRANAVKQYLVERFGIHQALLEAKGFGSSRLLLPEDPRNDQNRRVEVESLD